VNWKAKNREGKLENPDDQQPQHNALVRWKYTWYGRLAWALVDLVIAVIFGSLAIDSGTLWQWGIAVLFLLNGIYNLIRCIQKLRHGKSSSERTN
jgi:membrane protein YdbS with pleckstrin-like domain